MGNNTGDYDRAVRSACNILSYADNTEPQLRRKLLGKGYSSEAVNCAVEYVRSKGWLDEDRMLEAAVNSLVNAKLYGKNRVIAELRAKGFSRGAIAGYDFSPIDFAEICARLYEKRGGIPDDRTKAFLARYGHTVGDIRAACSGNTGNTGN